MLVRNMELTHPDREVRENLLIHTHRQLTWHLLYGALGRAGMCVGRFPDRLTIKHLKNNERLKVGIWRRSCRRAYLDLSNISTTADLYINYRLNVGEVHSLSPPRWVLILISLERTRLAYTLKFYNKIINSPHQLNLTCDYLFPYVLKRQNVSFAK